MANASYWIPIATIVFVWLLISSASAATDASDVSALQDLYRNLSYPSQLTGWKSKGGDPCEEQWKGISCDGTSIINIKLNGLDLGGYLGEHLNLMNLKQLDLSSNHIQGEIPSLLPPNATNIDLSCNNFNMSIPYTLNSMIHLRHLNFSHNALSGPIGNIFTSLHNLKQLDLSFNNFTGDLPSSFRNLTNLTGLYLQNNKFTGSVVFLANLPIHHLNIENNHFNGIIPEQLLHVPNLWVGGNKFHIGPEKIPHPLLLVWITMMISITYRVVLFHRPLTEFAYLCLDLLMDVASLWLQYLLEMCHLSGDESSYFVLHYYAIAIAVLVGLLSAFSMREHGPGAIVFGKPLAISHIVHTAYTSYLAYVGSPPSQLVRKLGIDISKAGLTYHFLEGVALLKKSGYMGWISRNGSL